LKPLIRQPKPGSPISVTSVTLSRPGVDTSALPWPLPTKPWWPSITYFTDRSPTTSWGIFT